ncbi:4-oxalocrotonate tautomerase [Rhodococcus sp. HNM0563]|uniref:tautomerase family protein n=1 Tax=unclassified Rhodococcus (in: high G+C Gram-positive bacteria) TaxID=192944 RepID=UPI00146E5A3A|nr:MULTISPECIES: tautomerase family protein [unclassified Rhodococcus (in: high G+C Gram-positive bacteria)]MCK0092977.1 tautomerase family protein [Rhodococcus sp. F64268]NLU62674.1 4-oxalocrotonate tautomerase [Rhodococcus sp. HNM0563]
MPLLELTYPKGALTSEARTGLVTKLTEILMHWESVPDTPFFRAATWVQLHERPDWAVNQGGQRAEQPLYLLSATVPEGALSQRRKAGMITDATAAIREADGGDPDPYRIWVHIHEIPDGNWGAGGQPIMFAELRAAAAQARADRNGSITTD